MKYSYLIFICSLLCMACEKNLEVNGGVPDFDVVSVTGTLTAGKPVEFNFNGDANIISFYSGEPLKDYAFRLGRIENTTGGTLSFTSAVTLGTQAGQFAVLSSTDFSGNYTDLTQVKAATWTNITSRFVLGTTAVFVNSGTVDISNLMVPGKPLYIAYRYITKSQALNGVGRTWQMQNFTYKANTALGSLAVLDMFSIGFRLVNSNPATAPSRSTFTTSRLTLLANNFTPDNDPETENWAISTPINWEKLDIGPDRPTGIKGTLSAKLESYTYTYAKAGTYKAYFVIANENIDERKEVVKEIAVTIKP